jgi:REP element-mobilizing transposase RayT
MARKPRLEFEGAIYHVINRGNNRKNLFGERGAAAAFENALFEACVKCGWKIHAHVMMSNHFHLAVETPEANLVRGMAAGELCQPLRAITWQARTCVSKPLQKHPD